jgi:cytochrome oxidase Cu insertion factor (SCO1/SenC/PrrC family)
MAAMAFEVNNETFAKMEAWNLRHAMSVILLVLSSLLPFPAWSGPISFYAVPYPFVDDRGETVHLSDWRGKPMILTMEHSTCRFSCSISISKLKAIQALADKEKLNIDFMIISIDPRNDTPETWRQFRESRDEERSNWHLLTGNETTTKLFANLFGMNYWYMEDHVFHDFKIVRLNANGEIEKMITDYDDDPEVLLK